jgi:hypothetical protein
MNAHHLIPNVYRFVFGLRPQEEPFHLLHYLCLASCITVNRPDKIIVHCLHSPWGPLWNRIVRQIDVVPISRETLNISLRYNDPFLAKYSYAHVADFVRLQILLEQGGIYADMDTLFVRPLPSSLFQAACVMGRERVDTSATTGSLNGSLCNAFIMAEPNAEFIRLWLERMPGAFDGSWSRHSTFLPYELSVQYPDLIHTEPEESFFFLTGLRKGLPTCLKDRLNCQKQPTAYIFGRTYGGIASVRISHDLAPIS